MFSTPATPTNNPRRPIASAALRSAGLISDDATMKDANDRSRPIRHRVYERPQPTEKDQSGSSSSKRTNLLMKLSAPRRGPGAIRGVTSTNTLAERLAVTSPAGASGRARRGALSRVPAGSPNATSRASVDLMREFIDKRWNPQAQFLNLERMADDEVLKKYSLQPLDSPAAPRAMGPVIFKLASLLEPPCLTISLANNNFTNTSHLSTLNHYLPNLCNLSLENNKIRLARELEPLAGHRGKTVSALKELVLKGNPIQKDASSRDSVEAYRSSVTRRFPLLTMLDQEPVTKIGFDVPITTSSSAGPSSAPQQPTSNAFPVEMGSNFFAGGVGGLTASFLTQFFTLFDTARTSLLPAYGPDSTFSYSCNTSIPPRARIKGYHTSKDMPNQKKLEWATYFSESRNLKRVVTLNKAISTLHAGGADIIKAFERMPVTKHSIGDAGKFVVDAWPLPGILVGDGTPKDALFITLHGEFAEMPSNGIRSFDRTFVLALAEEGSPAKQAGWPCVIVSDQLVVRAYSSPEVWTPGPLVVGGTPSISILNASVGGQGMVPEPQPQPQPQQVQPVPLDPILASIPEPQRSAVIHISARTGLNSSFGMQCLEGNGWDMERAIANFQELRASIPAEAFMR